MSVKSKLTELRDAISKIDVYRPAFERVNSLYADKMGEVTMVDRNAGAFGECPTRRGYWKLLEDVSKRNSSSYKFLPPVEDQTITLGGMLDLSTVETLDMNKFYRKDINSPFFIEHLSRLILPKRFGYIHCVLSSPPRELYLSRTTWSSTSTWVLNNSRHRPNYVKCPKESDVPYYLNKFDLEVESMVGIFENMIDRSNESSVKYITLGSTNLAKLTESQKEIAYSKGWDLQ